MTICLAGYFAEDRYIPRPENCAPAHLCGLVLRVGGLGTSVFSGTALGTKPRPAPLTGSGCGAHGISETLSL